MSEDDEDGEIWYYRYKTRDGQDITLEYLISDILLSTTAYDHYCTWECFEGVSRSAWCQSPLHHIGNPCVFCNYLS